MRYPADKPLELTELAALVQRQLPDDAIVVAESFSSLVALSLLGSNPSRVRGVIFVCGFAEPPRPLLLRLAPLLSRSAMLIRSAPSFMLRQYCLGTAASADDLNLLRTTVAAVSPAVLAQRLRLVAGRHSFGKGKFAVPCHYLRATQDKLVPASCAEWFTQHFRTCRVTDIAGPHFLLQAAPAKSADAISQAVKLLPTER